MKSRLLVVLAAAALGAVAAARACRPAPTKESGSFVRPPAPPAVEPPPPPPVPAEPRKLPETILREEPRHLPATILRPPPPPPPPPEEPAGGVWGTVTLQGPRPAPKRVRMDADPQCAALHADLPRSDDLVVGPAGQVRWAVVHVTRGLGGQRFESPTTPVLLEQIGCRFAPHVLAARVGQPVEIVNRDAFLHCVHGLPFANKEFVFGQPPGARDVRTFPQPEIFAVKSDIRPWMKAWIAVFDHPFFAVSDEEGRWRIVGLPPGRYELTVWHEALTLEKAELDVGPGLEGRRDFLLQRR